MAKSSIRILSSHEQSILRDSLYQRGEIRDWSLVQLCLNTGLRSAEVCRLNNRHLLHLQSGIIVSVLDVDAKIAYHQPRQLPLTDIVRHALMLYWEWKVDHGASLDTDAPFFCTLRTNKRLVPLDIQRVIKRTSESLGFEITPPDLRHTYAAELYRATQDLKLVQACLGLSSLRAVRMYRHHTKVEVEASGL